MVPFVLEEKKKKIKYNKTQTLRMAETLTCVKYQVQPTFPRKRVFLVIFQSAVLGIPPGCQGLEPKAPPGGKRGTLHHRWLDRLAAPLWWRTLSSIGLALSGRPPGTTGVPLPRPPRLGRSRLPKLMSSMEVISFMDLRKMPQSSRSSMVPPSF